MTKNDKIIIYHNNRCAKSREACSLLEKRNADITVIEYLKTPLSEEELKLLLKKLGLPAEELLRKKEPLFKEKFADKKRTDAEWIKIMVQNPVLIERPIVVKGDKAVIARPAERIKDLLS